MAKASKSKNETPPLPLGKKGKKGKQEEPVLPVDNKLRAKQGRAAVAESQSWTGKLPGSLLHEYCQKQKWEKVTYDMIHSKDGYIGILILAWKNPKSQEMLSIKMVPEKSIVKPQETSLEARHFAATYALHRIAFQKNLHMVLPTNHKNLWTDLETYKKKMMRENPNRAIELYTPEPFQAILDKRKLEEQKRKEELSKDRMQLKEKQPSMLISTKSQANDYKVSKKIVPTLKIKKYQNVTFPRKIWESAAFVDLKEESRELIYKSIKHHIGWTTHKSHLNPEETDYKSFIVSLGFRPSHVEESLKYTNSFTEALEWLIFHLPEDDLPPAFAKNEKDSNISLKISGDLKKEYMTKRLTEAGFDKVEVVLSLLKNDFDEVASAIELTYSLVEFEEADFNPESKSIWEDEMQSMEVIYGDRFKIVSEDICEIKLNALDLDPESLTLRVFRSQGYPNSLPGLHLLVSKTSYRLANYIRLSISKNLLNFILGNNLMGDSFIFTCIDWLENEIFKVIEDPGPLFTEPKAILKETQKSMAKSKASREHKVKELSSQEIKQLEAHYKEHYQTLAMKDAVAKRSTLPAWQKRQAIVELINNNKVTLITGETGSGKSTQAVQFILDDLISKDDFKSSIICTQPRRISTIGLAERISDERCGKCGQEVGYIIRGENKTTLKTRISFVTTGVLLRMVQGLLSSSGTDSFFNKIGYIFIDEVHERSIDSDFLLIILKKILINYPKLKIVLMSATTDVNIYRKYFSSELAHIHIEGRTFPIQDYYLDEILDEVDFTIRNNNPKDGESEILKPKADSRFFKEGNINNELIAKVVNLVHRKLILESNDGSLLIFLPGVLEINSCIRTISKTFEGECLLLPLHSALSPNEQKKVFNTPAKGIRKIVVATNVAETSITIPDAVCVIDTGKAKSLYYDPNMSTTRLIEDWCSQAEVGQRRGRAGRITKGNCYKLYTRETEKSMLKQPIPEIKRIRLENVYLVVKSMGIKNVTEFLNSGLDPPDKSTLKKSHDFLADIGAIVGGELTHLGSYLSMIPTDLQSGKLLIFGAIFGCLDTCLTLASIASTGSPFINSFENRDAIKKVQQEFAHGQGDLIAIVNAFNLYEELKGSTANKWLNENYLSFMKFKDMRSTRSQYITILQDLGFIPLDYGKVVYPHLNRNNSNWNIIKSIITGAFYPQVARVQLPDPKYLSTFSGAVAIDSDAKETKLWVRNEKYVPENERKEKPEKKRNGKEEVEEFPSTRAFLHPSSTLFIGNNNNSNVSVEEVQAVYDFTPSALVSKIETLKSSFAVFNASLHTTRFYLRDITPSSSLSVLLFGGDFTYDLSGFQNSTQSSPGIILDGWLPIRTWCKNGVLIKQLRVLLDNVISEKLESPSYKEVPRGDDVLSVVEKILELDAVK